MSEGSSASSSPNKLIDLKIKDSSKEKFCKNVATSSKIKIVFDKVNGLNRVCLLDDVKPKFEMKSEEEDEPKPNKGQLNEPKVSKQDDDDEIFDLTNDDDNPPNETTSDEQFEEAAESSTSSKTTTPESSNNSKTKQELQPKKRKTSDSSHHHNNDRKRSRGETTDDKPIMSLDSLKQRIVTIANVKVNSCCDCQAKLKEVQERNAQIVAKNAQFVKVINFMKQQIEQLKGKREVRSAAVQCSTPVDHFGLMTQTIINQRSSVPPSPVPSTPIPSVRSPSSSAGPTASGVQTSILPKPSPPNIGIPTQGSQIVTTPPKPPGSTQSTTRFVMVPANHSVAINRFIRPTNGSSLVRYTVSSPTNLVNGNKIYINGGTQNNNNSSSPAGAVGPPPLTRAPRAAAVRADHNLATRTETSATTSSRHPLPLPLPPYPNATRKISTAVGLSPPEPALSCQKSTDPNNVGVQLTWTHSISQVYANIKQYQLYAYQENPNSTWKQVGLIEPLELPMACTLTAFAPGEKYHFAIRAIDIYDRIGPFSKPCTLKT